MTLAFLDWIIIVAYLILAFGIGFLYKNQASKSLSDFFLGGRNLPWYIAGISMVATTFAADTPLWVTEVIAQHGVSGNWLWWNMLIGGMLTTFFFAKLWRRAEVVTELEFIELRY
ncbi:MAG: sodium:proline symporter, partial [Vicingaceae bacterium]